MPTSDVRDVLRELPVPPESPEFFDELRHRLHEHDRAQARRWRRTAVAVAAVAVAAITAAAVFAATRGGGSTVTRTASCTTTSGAVHINANAFLPQQNAGVAGVDTGPTDTALFVIDTRYSGFTLNGSRCRVAATRIPLARAGLPSGGVYTPGYGFFNAYCSAPGRAFVRFRVHLDSAGKPQDAQIAVWAHRSRTGPLRPLAFLQWSPQRLVTYVSPRCTTQ